MGGANRSKPTVVHCLGRPGWLLYNMRVHRAILDAFYMDVSWILYTGGIDNSSAGIFDEDFAGWTTPEQFESNIRVIEDVLKNGTAPRTGKMLEIGCGAGNISIWFAEQGYEVSGMDIAPTAVDWAREQASEKGITADFRVGNVVHLEEFEDESFDMVIDGHCLHCIIGQDRAVLLRNVHRVLKPGGYCLIITMCTPVDESGLQNYDPQSRCTFHEGFATRYWGYPEEIMGEMRAAGFEIVWSLVRKDEPSDPCHGILLELIKPPVA